MKPLVLMSSLATGGAERVTASFLRHLARSGSAVPLCTLTARGDGTLAEELRLAGVPRYDLGARRLADPLALVRLARLLRRGRFDLVHAHGQDAAVLALATRPFARAALVATRHVMGEPAASWRERGRAALALAVFRRADAVVAVSVASADQLAATSGLPRGRVRVIPNGVELERFDPAAHAAGRASTRAALGVDSAAPLVLVPAVLRPGKGHDVLLEAIPALRERIPSVRVLVAGAGPLEADLRARAQSLGEAVEFLGPRDDVPELLAAADLVVLPSFQEALPTVLMEAAAAGRPVVATRVGGVSEVVEDGRTGVLVPPRDAGALCDAVAGLLRDPARAHAYGDAGAAMARRRFGINEQVRATWALWEEVTARASR